MDSKISKEQTLAQRFKNGDQKAFNELFNLYEGKIMAFCIKKTGNTLIAEDLYQITWEKIIKNIYKYDTSMNFSSWFYTICNNTIKDWFKSKNNFNRFLQESKYLGSNPENVTDIGNNIDMSALNNIEQEILILKYIKGFQHSEIAEQKKLTPSNVRKILSRTKAKLKKHLLSELK